MTPRVETHIRLGIRSVSDQTLRCLHEETFGPYLLIAKFRGVSPRNVAEFLSFSSKTNFRARGVPWRNAKKELFAWADLYFRFTNTYSTSML